MKTSELWAEVEAQSAKCAEDLGFMAMGALEVYQGIGDWGVVYFEAILERMRGVGIGLFHARNEKELAQFREEVTT